MPSTSQTSIINVAQETFRTMFSFILPASNLSYEATNPPPTSTASYETYTRHMSPMGHGYPLWIPGPNETLRADYRKKGVTVGDVVVFTTDGAVDFVFNIFRPANDPIQENGVPDGFSPQTCSRTRRYQQYGEDSYLASKSITKKVEKIGPSGTVFLSSAPEGAILTMPKGAYSEDIAHLSGLDQYVSDNLESWYKYVSEVLRWDVKMGKLHLVTGVHKSLAWGMVTFLNGPDAGEVRLRFNSRNEPPYGWLYSWESDGQSDCPRAGPTKEQKISLSESIPSSEFDYPYENQCLFVRTINATLRTPKAQKATLQTLCQVGPSQILNQAGGFRRFGSSPNKFTSQSSDHSRKWANHSNDLLLTTHPSEYINQSLLEMRANARIVITHDEDWMSLLTEDDYVYPDNQEFFERLILANDIIEKDGVISLKRSDRHPMRSTPPPASDAAKAVNIAETITTSRLSFECSEAESSLSSGTSYATGHYTDYRPQMYLGHLSMSTGATTNQISDVQSTMSTSGKEPPLKLLALDGGGIRGLSELLIIKEVMHGLMVEENAKREKEGRKLLSEPPKPCNYFDLIGGTSTGGIIALMLGRLRMDVDSAIDHYDNLVKKVFSSRKLWGDGEFKAMKLEEAVKSVVRSVIGDSESPLLEEGPGQICRTFVCAKNANNMGIPVRFRTYPSREVHIDCTIWEAARATSAAPTFFKCIVIGPRDQSYIDGGLGYNNPCQMVLDEAQALFGDRQIGCLVSIGAGQAQVVAIERPRWFQQVIPTNVIEALKAITTDCEKMHQEMLDYFAKLPNTYFRLNVEQGMQGIELSEWEKLSTVEVHTVQYIKEKEVQEKLSLLVRMIQAPRVQVTLEELVTPQPLTDSAVRQIRERKLCPPPVELFTGRRDILNQMHLYFRMNSNRQHIFVLHGLGGSGKSQLALKFVEESTQFSDIFYVDATNEQTLRTDLESIAPENVEQSVDESLRWLASQAKNSQWLLLFDNADDVNLKLNEYFPFQCGNILITTRNVELCTYAGKDGDAKVGDMDHIDATNLLLRQAWAEQNDENRVLADAIVKELHYFTLAVSQAGVYIYCHSSLKEYLAFYLHERDHLLDEVQFQSQDPYARAVYATWKLSYDRLDISAKTFLHICSMLHHNGISEKMFERAALAEEELEDSQLQSAVNELLSHLGKQKTDSGLNKWDTWRFQMVIRHLCSYSFIECDNQNHTYSIHPLVQHWNGAAMENNRLLMQKCILSIIALSISFEMDDYKYQHLLLQHISKLKRTLDIRDITSSVLQWIACVYSNQGHWKEAEELEVEVMQKRKQLLGDNHPSTLTSMNNLASTYWNQGRWMEAEKLEVEVMEKRKQVLGDDHPDTLTSMGNLASIYRDQGRWKEAEELEVEVMEKRKQVLGDDHPDTLTSMGNLASIYRDQGRWKEAEKLEVEVMEKRKHLFGNDHPNTLTSMGNLASIYCDQGHWKEAEELQVEVMEKRKQLFGDDHPNTLTSMANLASTYRNQGHWKKAEELQVEVMEKSKQLLGDNHPNTLTSMANLASIYRDQGRWKEAEELEVEVMEKRKQLFGDNHPETLMSMANLASTYRNQGHWEEAEELQVEVMEKRKHLLGDDHPDTLTSMANLASTYQDQGRWKKAEELGVEVMEKTKQLLGDDHPDTLTSMADLASTYWNQGNWKEAKELQVEVMEKRKQVLGQDHPHTVLSMKNLAKMYHTTGRRVEAEGLNVLVKKAKK